MLKSIVARSSSWQTSRRAVAASAVLYLSVQGGREGDFTTKYPAESSFYQTYPKSRANTHTDRG